MKCLKCGKNSLYRERSGGKCSGCGQKFVFEPKTGDLFADTVFQKALERVSHQSSLSFHRRQLYYELARVRMKKLPGKLGAVLGMGFLGVFLGIFWTIFWLKIMSIGSGIWLLEGGYLIFWAIILVRAWRKTDSGQIRFDEPSFDKTFSKWQKEKGLPQEMLQKSPALPHGAAKHPEKDMLDYAVERAIICDHPTVVDFLLANNFHIEQKCAILSFGGYPPDRFEDLRRMLKKNSQLNVFVVHNASANGCRIFQELISSPEWFKGSKRVFDIGLHPRHAKAFAGLWLKATSQSLQPILGYTPEEMEWLKQNKLELMAIPPAKLLKHLRNVLNGQARSLADAYARGDSDSGVVGGDIMVATDIDGWEDDFG